MWCGICGGHGHNSLQHHAMEDFRASEIKPEYAPARTVITVPKVKPITDLHETLKLDRYGNTYEEHTTIKVGSQVKWFPWNKD